MFRPYPKTNTYFRTYIQLWAIKSMMDDGMFDIYDMIYLLTAIGFSTGDSITVHIEQYYTTEYVLI